MNFTIEKETIAKSLKAAASVAERKTTIPILSYARLTAAKAKLTICATNLEMGFRVRHEADVKESGEICLPAKLFSDIVANLPNGPLKFSADYGAADVNIAMILTNSGVYEIFGLAPDDFPILDDPADIIPMPVSAAALRGLIHKTLYAVSTDAIRGNICGGFLQRSAGKLLAVATDGHRMAKAVNVLVEETLNCGLAEGVIIPRNALQKLVHILDGCLEKTVLIGAAQNFFFLRVFGEDYTFHTKLIEDNFPDYSRVLPKEMTIPVVICRKTLLESLQRMNILASGNNTVLEVALGGTTLSLTLDNPHIGMVKETHKIGNLQNKFCTTMVDIRLLLSIVEPTHEDEIVIDLSEGAKPLQVMNLSAMDDEEKDYVGIVMPLRM